MAKALPKLAVLILICESVGLVSSVFAFPSGLAWYATLVKPNFTPPSWLFGPAWLTLYALMGSSLYLASAKRAPIYWFVSQLIFNFLWSILFFTLHQPLFAFIDILLLLYALVQCLREFYPRSKPSAYLLTPYLLWSLFAALLNFFIILLN